MRYIYLKDYTRVHNMTLIKTNYGIDCIVSDCIVSDCNS